MLVLLSAVVGELIENIHSRLLRSASYPIGELIESFPPFFQKFQIGELIDRRVNRETTVSRGDLTKIHKIIKMGIKLPNIYYFHYKIGTTYT